ncbi:Hypothetical protein CINCED_3A022091 [Cinara cedri]|uniref:Uncharacterized protein n=1 Tax=Cinara cedri TaxID=506608 RepID=A0A5E4N5L2_9HEMI|nr:Hypothetical protein CINCED_3A022091 [Cinara cedri]
MFITESSNVSDFVELAQLAGVKIAPNVVSALLELLDLGYSPSSIRKVCREVAKYKSRHEKSGTTMNSTS